MDRHKTKKSRPAGWKATLLVCLLILLAGAGLTLFIFSTEPTAQRVGASKETAMLVEVTGGERGSFRPVIRAMGTVVAARDIVLSPRVGGRIVHRAPDFNPGGLVEKGEILLRIDPADYEHALRRRRSELRRAEADRDLEMGRQRVARRDFRLLDEEISPENEALVLRKPQLRVVQARVESAATAVSRARLDLERTEITAPFAAQVLSRLVDLGSQVSPGDELGRLVGLDTYWVEVRVPLAKLGRLSFPDEAGGEGSEVVIRNRTAWPEGTSRTGRIYRLVGALAEQTRMARVLVEIADPLARRPESTGLPPLILGSFVEAAIRGREIFDVIRLDRDYVRKDDTVWLMEEGKLAIREVEIVFSDARFAYISDGLSADDRIVTTNLSTVAEGARLRVEESASGPDGEGGGDGDNGRSRQGGGSGP